MNKIFLAVAICTLLSGCADIALHDYNSWSNKAEAEMLAGKISRSDYYQEAYKRASALPNGVETKPMLMQYSSNMLNASIALENGKISKEQFDSYERQMEVAKAQYLQMLAKEHRERALQDLGAASAFYSIGAPQQMPSNTINCTSHQMGAYTTTNCQ